MKRIFYYSGYQLSIFHWHNEKCVASYIFNPGEQGLEKFKIYLLSTNNSPVRLLLDLIEEDFKKETIPHVGSADRRSIVNRLIDRQYRKSKSYVHYKVVAREKSGRKDDILLYSVLSNPEILQPWLKTMMACNTSISGIWSLPLLSENLFKKLNPKAKNVLLVSQQVPSHLRQTFIKNGKLESSRSVVVNLQDAPISEYIATEVEQTIHFLSNQRLTGFNEKIEIHIICRDADIAAIKSHCIDSLIRSFHYHKLADVKETLGCLTPSTDQVLADTSEYCNCIYSFVCAMQTIPIGHYGAASIFLKYYEQLTCKALYASSAVILIFASILSFANLAESFTLDTESSSLKDQTKGVNNNYTKSLQKLKYKLSQAQVMQSSVLLSKKIQQAKTLSPQNFMSDVSKILTQSDMLTTEITQISWQQQQSNILPIANNHQNIFSTDYAKIESINQHATITGFIHSSQNDLKDSVNKINAIVEAFKNNKRVQIIRINHMPVDIRSKSSIENVSGIKQDNNLDADKNKGHFEIEILMKGRES